MGDKPECSTGKRRFATAGAAQDRLRAIQANPDPSRLYQPTDVRRCPQCKGYHLTSKSGKTWKTGKRGRNLRVR